MFWGGIVWIVSQWFDSSIPQEKYRFLKRLLIAIFSLSIPVVGWLIWKYNYYRNLLPNTYYAKHNADTLLAGIRGVKYLIGGIWNGGVNTFFWFIVPLVWLLGILPWRKLTQPDWLYPLVFLMINIVVIVWSGGGFMPNSRFLATGLPFLFVLDSIYLGNILSLKWGKSWQRIIFVIFLILLSAMYPIQQSLERNILAHKVELSQAEIAQYLNRHTVPKDTVALVQIGQIGYRGEFQVLDMVGLTNAEIAKLHYSTGASFYRHFSGLPLNVTFNEALVDYILEEAPKYIVYTTSDLAATEPTLLTPRLHEDPRFDARYVLERSFVSRPEVLIQHVYRLK